MDIIRHRGPNDERTETYNLHKNKFLTLGHARLSIIDLSERGRQPMHDATSRFSIVFNGEIYNYVELRKELEQYGYSFNGGSDTEVLLACWYFWGADCIKKLVGMFSFVVFDRLSNTITCVRDAFGVKPLFYAKLNECLMFASETSALIALDETLREQNFQKSYEYLVHGVYDNSSDTFYREIKQLKPAHYIVYDINANEASQQIRWWTHPTHEVSNVSFDEAITVIRSNFLSAVELHMRSDVPIAFALSGGIDSSAIVCAARHVSSSAEINTFSYVAGANARCEEPWIDIVNAEVGARAHKFSLNLNDLVSDLDRLIINQGEPFGSASILAQYKLFELVKSEGFSVVLEGQGADEVFAGYIGHPGKIGHSMIDNGNFLDVVFFLNNWARTNSMPLSYAVKQLIADIGSNKLKKMMERVRLHDPIPRWVDHNSANEMGLITHHHRFESPKNSKGRHLANYLLHCLTEDGLPKLLRHSDRNSMAFSVESRVPFLTIEQVGFALSLPDSYLISSNGITKHVFREAMRGIVPDIILARRDKIGFEPPEKDLINKNYNFVRACINDGVFPPFLRKHSMLKELDDIFSDRKKFDWRVWRWLNYFRWVDLCLKH